MPGANGRNLAIEAQRHRGETTMRNTSLPPCLCASVAITRMTTPPQYGRRFAPIVLISRVQADSLLPMSSRICLVTGSSGLIGSEVAAFFHERGFAVHGVDNNQGEAFFGAQGNTRWNQGALSPSPK